MPANSFDANPAEGDAPPTAPSPRRSLTSGHRAIALGAVVAVALIYSAGFGWSAPAPHPWLGFAGGIPSGQALWKLAGVQLLAAGLCGYLAGQRSHHVAVGMRHEQRDAVVAWLLALLVLALLTVFVGDADRRRAAFVEMPHDVLMRHVNGLFQSPQAASLAPLTPKAELAARRAVNEVAETFINAGQMSSLPPSDLRYVGRLVALRTGLGQREAELRVGAAHGLAKQDLQQLDANIQAIEDRRFHMALVGSLWLCVSLLAGAFVASKAAMFGRRR